MKNLNMPGKIYTLPTKSAKVKQGLLRRAGVYHLGFLGFI
jgi:hypothetical protein